MRSFLRFSITVVGLILIAGAILGLLAVTQWHRITKTDLERSFSLVLGATTTIDRIVPLPHQGGVAFEGFTIMNPPEFEEEPAFHFDRVEVFFDWHTLFSQTPTISLIRLQGGEVNYRYDVGRGSNMAGLTGSREDESPEIEDGASVGWPSMSPKRRFLIKRLEVVDGATLRFSSNLAPVNLPSVDVSTFKLQDIALDQPVSAPYLIAVLVRNLAGEALGVRDLLGPVDDMLQNELERFDDKAEDTAEEDPE